jgi:uncharacterized membrane protein
MWFYACEHLFTLGIGPVRIVLFVAVVANSLDLVATAFGIHWFGNREGNPLLASLAHGHWWLFVLVKGILTPLLIVQLHRSRDSSPVLATFGMGLVTLALTVAVGQWLGWIAGVVTVTHPFGL